MPLPVTDARSHLTQDAYLWGADAGNPLPAGEGFSLALPPELPFRRLYLCAYVRDHTICQALASFTLFDGSEPVQEFAFSMSAGAVQPMAAGQKERSLYPSARPPFTVLDSASGAGYQDTTAAAGDAMRFVWRAGRDINVVCYPLRVTVKATRLVMKWDGVRDVTTGSFVTAVAAAAVLSSNYPS